MAVRDGVNKGFHEDWEIVRSDPLMVIWWALGIGLYPCGFSLLKYKFPQFTDGSPVICVWICIFYLWLKPVLEQYRAKKTRPDT